MLEHLVGLKLALTHMPRNLPFLTLAPSNHFSSGGPHR